MSDFKRINLFLSNDTHRQFKVFCSSRESTMQMVLEGLVKQAISPRTAAPPPARPTPPRPAPPPEPYPVARVCPDCTRDQPLGTVVCECGENLDENGADVRMSDGTQDVDTRTAIRASQT